MRALPVIDEQLLELGEEDNSCPICIVPFIDILTKDEKAHKMDSPAQPVGELGVTKLSQSWQCGHVFCRRDNDRYTCPLCRGFLVEDENFAKPAAERPPENMTEFMDMARRMRTVIELTGLIVALHFTESTNPDYPSPDGSSLSRTGQSLPLLRLFRGGSVSTEEVKAELARISARVRQLDASGSAPVVDADG